MAAIAERSGGESEAPAWPDLRLSQRGDCLGCEREGKREETYTVVFRTPDGESASCDLDAQRWAAFGAGTRWTGSARAITGNLVCDSLSPAR